METKDLVQTLKTPTEAIGSPSEGSGQSCGLFSSRRPHLPPASVTHAPSRAFRLLPFRHRFVHATGRSHLPGVFRRRTRQHLRPPTPPSARRLPRVPASLSPPPPASGHRRRRRAAASSLEPPPPSVALRLVPCRPSPSVWYRSKTIKARFLGTYVRASPRYARVAAARG